MKPRLAAFALAAALTCGPAAASGARLNLEVEPGFNGGYQARQGAEVDLGIRPRWSGAQGDYEATGVLFGRRLDFGRPLALRRADEGLRRVLVVSGAGIELRLSRMDGWPDMDMEFSGRPEPAAAAVLHALLAGLPGLSLSNPSSGAPAPGGPVGATRITFRKIFEDQWTSDGSGLALRMRRRPLLPGDWAWDIEGEAFGRRFMPGELSLSTDKSWLGPGGWRVRGGGVDLELRHTRFAGRERLELRGEPGDSADLALFLVGFAQHVLPR